ncbi:FAD-dependent oxidoreductase [Nonlabens spongiae]|uniref:FAD-dependent oxidoreductase n=1 Tax=Nonlabens spongiae TaxID=331648 RepID=A0A1W6MN50_9FLAO|nr:FAD-dependent oxidoreductase [Nonlabens spongiae]ARN79018.1 FAD-dependent oxidoreductase [Nonlabens spongiae]
MQVDNIIVGSGISGCCLAWRFYFNSRSFVMISDRLKSSSSVAAGVYNPTILKRFTSVWKGEEQLDSAIPFYKKIEGELNAKLLHPISIYRRFHDKREVVTWCKKSAKSDLSRFMVDQPLKNVQVHGIDAPHGFGEVTETGWLDTVAFMAKTIEFFKSRNQVLLSSFDYDQLQVKGESLSYNDFTSNQIFFADGYRITDNPYFNNLPIQGNKGEVLTIKVPGLKLDHIIKSSVFLMPYKDDLFWVGATYDRHNLDYNASASGLEFLTSRLERFLKLPYEIIDHKAGIRPTTQDRRPFLGSHADHKNVICFNGMGSRAVLMAPWAASQLYDHVFHDKPLPPEIDIARFQV